MLVEKKYGGQNRTEKPENLELPVNKTYSDEYYDSFEYINEYEIKNNTKFFTSRTESNVRKGDTATVQLTDDSTTPVMVVFYYKAKPECTLTVTHIDDDTGDQLGGTAWNKTIPLVSGEKVEDIPSYTPNGGYINRSAVYDNTNDLIPPDKRNTTEKYEVTVPIPENNSSSHILEFHYFRQEVEIHHQDETGQDLVKKEVKYVPTTETKLPNAKYPDFKYPFLWYQLNGGPQNTGDTVTVQPDPNIPGIQKLVFFYEADPELVVDTNDPDPEKAKLAQELGVGLIPNDLNNELIGQDNNAKYWVLDKKAGVIIAFAQRDEAEQVTGCDITLKFPFDVYVDGELKRANTEVTYNNLSAFTTTTKTASNGKEYTIYKLELNNIEVPVWAEEKTYEGAEAITLTVVQHYNKQIFDDATQTVIQLQETNTESTSAGVTIVGQIYDFSVTSILGDDMWKTSAFTPAVTGKEQQGEHEADTLPLGQYDQQNSKYLYGIKQGSKFYFSVNTKGSNNTAIKIVPKFYYVDKNGNLGNEVIATSKGQNVKDITLERAATITDANRGTSEFRSEMVKAREMYPGVTYGTASEGNYGSIKLGTNLRTPYIQYLNEEYVGKGKRPTEITDNKVLEEVSHWYGDYMLPNDTTYTYADGTAVPTDGFVVVYFSIVSGKGENGNEDYLAYNLASPDNQTAEQTQWEQEEAKGSYTLPQVTVAETTPVTVGSWLQGTRMNQTGYAPVIIYDIDQRAKDNYDTTGTH